MPGGLLVRKGQVAAKIESVEGTAESLAAADATLPAYNIRWGHNLELVKRLVQRKTLTRLPRVAGKQFAALAFEAEVKGSGTVATVPAWDVHLRACGFQRRTVQRIAIGAVTSGPFLPGETITGGTSSGTGLVVGAVKTGDATVPYVVLTGTLQSGEVLTGSRSGATATTSGAPSANQGYLWTPISTLASIPSLTMAAYDDGLRKLVYGCRGSLALAIVNGGLGSFDFGFQGVLSGVTDVALLSPTYETQVPPTFLDARLAVQGFEPHFTNLSLDLGNVVTMRETANSTKGGLSAIVTDREPILNIDPESTLVADHDWWGKLAASTLGYFHAQIGDAAGERVVIASPNCEYVGLADGDRGGMRTLGVQLALVGASINTEDDELQIAQI